MNSILFGSIGTIVDTSEIQRQAFNQAFEEHGLGWQWERDDYVSMLDTSGGRDRIAEYAKSRGETVDADAVHETKSDVFQTAMRSTDLESRPGVAETIRKAKDSGLRVAMVTTTSADNVHAMIGALSDVALGDFDLVLDTTDVERPKPDPSAYEVALERLGADAGDCIAIEDNVGGVRSAVAAGLTCVAFPNQNTAGHDFDGAATTVERIDLDALTGLGAQ